MKKTEFIGVRVTPKIKDILQQLADRDDRTLAYVACKALQEYANKHITESEPLKNYMTGSRP